MEKFSILEWKKREIIFTVLVIFLVFGISWYQVKIGEMKTRDSQRMQDLGLISRAVRTYFGDYKEYPMEATGEGKILSCGNKGEDVCPWGGGPMVDIENVVYLNKLPRDPKGDLGFTYVYIPDSKRQHFKIYTYLEYSGTPGIKKDLTIKCGERVQCNWYVEE